MFRFRLERVLQHRQREVDACSRDVAAARAKKERDLRLLAASVQADPDDWYSWFKTLELARFWDDRELWRETAESVVNRLEGPPPAPLE